MIQPILASNAAVYAIQNATTEGKITVIVLLVLSLFSWTIIISKFRQLSIATHWTSRAAGKVLKARRRINFISEARTSWRIN